MSVLERLKNLVSGAHAAVGQLQEAMAKLQERQAALLEEEQRLLSRPAPKAELKATIVRLVKETRAKWIADNGLGAVQALSGRIERAMGPADARRPDEVIAGRMPESLANGYLTLESLAALVPDVAIAGVAALIEDVEYSAGPPMVSRLERLGQISAELASIEHEQVALADAGAAAGLSIPLPAAVAASRQRIRERHEAWKQDVTLNRRVYERHPELKPREPEQ